MLNSFNSIPLKGKENKPKGRPKKPKIGAPQEGQPEAKMPVTMPVVLVALLPAARNLTISLLKTKSAI